MIVAFDNTFLSLALNPKTKPRPNPATGAPASHCAERVDALVDALAKREDTVLIPTPCLSELLCIVPDLEKAVGEINGSVAFEIASFDARCAIDLASVTREAIENGDKKSGTIIPWQEIKFDRQIAVIAKVGGAEVFYTDDKGQAVFANKLGLKVLHTWDLDLPQTTDDLFKE